MGRQRRRRGGDGAALLLPRGAGGAPAAGGGRRPGTVRPLQDRQLPRRRRLRERPRPVDPGARHGAPLRRRLPAARRRLPRVGPPLHRPAGDRQDASRSGHPRRADRAETGARAVRRVHLARPSDPVDVRSRLAGVEARDPRPPDRRRAPGPGRAGIAAADAVGARRPLPDRQPALHAAAADDLHHQLPPAAAARQGGRQPRPRPRRRAADRRGEAPRPAHLGDARQPPLRDGAAGRHERRRRPPLLLQEPQGAHPVRLSAIDCLRRGFTSLRANWELVVVRWISGMVLAAFLLLGLVFPLLILGVDLFRATEGDPEDAQRLAVDILSRLGALTPALLSSLVGTLALWTFACVLYCWVQAGIFGVLVAADRQAPSVLPPGRALHGWFRTFNRKDFFGWGGRYLGRFFGLLNLFGALALGLALLALVWIVFIIAGAKRWGGAASLGIGCGGALPIAFLCLVLGLWFTVSQAD